MADASLNMFDLGVLIIIGLSALLSFFRGFVRELTSLAAWLGASLLTLHLIGPVSKWIEPQVHSAVVANGVASIGIFLIALIVISIITGLVLKVLKPGAKVGLFDNLVGLCFGVARGVLIVAIAYFVMTKFFIGEKNYPDVVKQAISRPYVEKAANWVGALTPTTLNAITEKAEKKSVAGADEAKKGMNQLIQKWNAPGDKPKSKSDIDEDMPASSLPSMEDLQKRIRDENEKK